MITLTADAFEESVRAANSAGINDRITKPVDPGRLCDTLMKLG